MDAAVGIFAGIIGALLGALITTFAFVLPYSNKLAGVIVELAGVKAKLIELEVAVNKMVPCQHHTDLIRRLEKVEAIK